MSFSSNDTIKKITKIIPLSINNQIVPTDVLGIIDEYIPKLDDKNIHQVVKDYLSNSSKTKQQVINNYGPISNWDVSNVTNMTKLFQNYTNKNYYSFNEDISKWNVSNVTDMSSMFAYARLFNQPLNNWDVSKVTDMRGMFYHAFNFDQPLNNWNVSNVTNMNSMFGCAKSFNQSLNNWNVSNVTNMSYMFVNTVCALNTVCAFDPDRAKERYKLLKDWNLSIEEGDNIFSVEYVEDF